MKKIAGIFASLGLLLLFCVPRVEANFVDLNGHWAETYVDQLATQRVVSGYGDGRYGPDELLTRGQMAKIVALAFDLEVQGSSAEDYVDAVIEYGIAEGYRNSAGVLTGDFGANDPLTRAQAVKMLVLAGDLSGSGTMPFRDVSGAAWYYNYLRAAYSNQLVSGYDDGRFGPNDFVTRGQIAKMTVLAEEAANESTPVTVSSVEEETPVVSGTSSGGGSSGATATPPQTPVPVETTTPIVPVTPTVSTPPAESTAPSVVEPPLSSGLFAGASFYVDLQSSVYKQVAAWKDSRPADAADLQVIAVQPTARWFGDWSGDIQAAVNSYVTTVSGKGNLPVLVAYNIPGRDCGSFSAGGSASADQYRTWIQGFADGVGARDAVVVLEPDALPLDCMFQNSVSLLADAVTILKSNSHVVVYIDAGHPNWVPVADMATRLKAANVSMADGFALNVSNFYTTAENISYGTAISALIGDKHFIIDTSRNGNGWNGEWCNPSGRSLGENPTTDTGNPLVDAFLWVKPPGESDGTCNGGPSAGAWWADYALGLVRN